MAFIWRGSLSQVRSGPLANAVARRRVNRQSALLFEHRCNLLPERQLLMLLAVGFDGAGCVMLAGSEAGKLPTRPAFSF